MVTTVTYADDNYKVADSPVKKVLIMRFTNTHQYFNWPQWASWQVVIAQTIHKPWFFGCNEI